MLYYEMVSQAIIMAIKKNIPMFCIHSDSKVIINTINGKIDVPKDIINLVKDIRCFLSHIKESRLEYYNRTTNRDANTIAKRTHL